MAVFAIPNPKKSTIVDFPIERIKQSVQNINLVNNKYKFTKANEIFNQYTYEALEFLSLGIFVDINLNAIEENKTEITVEIRRKIGSFNQAHEITKANEHLDKIFTSIAELTAKSPNEIEALKANNNFSKANKKKDDRPFYKKKRFIIPLAFLVLMFLIGVFSDDTSTNNPSSESNKTEEVANSNNGMDLKTKIENNIKSIEGGDDLTKNELNSATDFQIAIAIFKAYALTINEGKQSTDKEVLKLTDELQKKVIASQQKNFPKLRAAYYKFIKNTLWEHDVDVNLSGSNNTTLKFTGAYFAANKNIKTTQEALHEMLTLLRFKQTQYRWYKGEDEYTYYNIESPKDNEIVE
ncbi:MAG TPA: hypothetical protein PKX92_11980 [Edaphocola sp.]|nr:hypothetical protein [Edaphocola sp.]